MEIIQAIIMLVLAIGFNGGPATANGEALPLGAILAAPGTYKPAEEVFSGENQYRKYVEAEDGTLIMNPAYRNASGPEDDPTNQPQTQETSDYFDDGDGPTMQPGGYWYYYEDPEDLENSTWKYVPPFGDY